MQAKTANLINGLALTILGLWGAMGSDSKTAFIPVVGGVILLALQSGVAKHNKMIAHIAVIVTLVMLVGLIKPFLGTMDRGDTIATVRVGIMLLTGVLAMIAFIKSFIEARKQK